MEPINHLSPKMFGHTYYSQRCITLENDYKNCSMQQAFTARILSSGGQSRVEMTNGSEGTKGALAPSHGVGYRDLPRATGWVQGQPRVSSLRR